MIHLGIRHDALEHRTVPSLRPRVPQLGDELGRHHGRGRALRRLLGKRFALAERVVVIVVVFVFVIVVFVLMLLLLLFHLISVVSSMPASSAIPASLSLSENMSDVYVTMFAVQETYNLKYI